MSVEVCINMYSNSEIYNAINDVITNEYDRRVLCKRLIEGVYWKDLCLFNRTEKEYYIELCNKVLDKLSTKEAENEEC